MKTQFICEGLEQRGTVALREGTYGPTLYVNDIEIGYIDLFPPTKNPPEPPQILIFDPNHDEPLCKIIVVEGRPVVTIHERAVVVLERDGVQPSTNDGKLYSMPFVEEEE